jgi:hypothetical protein
MNVAHRLIALLHRLRLSPLMGGVLAAAALFDLIGLLVFGLAFFPSQNAAPDIRADWRPPTLAKYEAMQPKPASADVETLNRPIFSKSRKPYAAKEKKNPDNLAAMAPVAPPPGLSLAGVTKYRNKPMAFMVSSSTPKGKWLAVGDQIDGWSVTQVQNMEITLASGERIIRLSLYPEPQK